MNLPTMTLLLTLFLLSVTVANENQLTGVVVDATTNEPIPGCEVIGGQQGSTTDNAGRWKLTGHPNTLITFQHIAYETIIIPATELPAVLKLQPMLLQGEEVSVYGALRTQSLLETDGGVTVISKREISTSSEPHFQKLLHHVPNLNWAGGSSRPRYFQIRGMGERSQFAGDGPPNYSVGYTIDDIDLSGIGMSGLTFDVNRVELFRGPQSSIYGPNALAGFIVLRSNDPEAGQPGEVSITVGNAELLNMGVALNVLEKESLSARLAAYRGYNNGFQENRYLDRSNTNERLETMARLKVIWQAHRNLTMKATMLTVDLDNGYDAWSPDNSGFITYSDTPGKDSQILNAGVVKMNYQASQMSNVYYIAGYSQADMVNSYDSDWGNDDFWAQEPYNFDPAQEGWSYSFFDRVTRLRKTLTQELRLVRTNGKGTVHFILGGYYKDLTETDNAEGYLFGGDESELSSEFYLQNQSIYSQLDLKLLPELTFTTNLRIGQRQTDYKDDKSTAFSVKDQLNGGKLGLLYNLNDRKMVFITAARGFKAGGINQHPRILDRNRPFAPEYVNSYEVGYRGMSQAGMLSVIAFYTQRHDQQVSLSSQQDPMDPNSFTYYIGNASQGHVSGLEIEARRAIGTNTTLSGSLGLLESKTEEYSFEIELGRSVSLGDRAFAHAPSYSYRIHIDHDFSDQLNASLSLSGKDKFYFSESHDQESAAYELLNLRLAYQVSSALEISGWADNLLDKKYATRGFYFGLEPPDYANKLYMSYGDPRQAGMTLKYSF